MPLLIRQGFGFGFLPILGLRHELGLDPIEIEGWRKVREC